MKNRIRRFALAALISWAAGVVTLSLALRLGSPEDFTLQDITALALTLGLASLPALVLATLLLSWLGRRIESRAVLAVTGGIALAIPAALATAGAVKLGSMPVGEAALFTGAFLVEGLFLGALAAVPRAERSFLRRAALAAALAAAIPAVAWMIPVAGDRLESGSAENGTVAAVARMSIARSNHTATLLQDGTVLLAGGMVSVVGDEVSTATAEVYDPRSRRYTRAGDMTAARAGHTATLLESGDVLITGGMDDTAELYSAADRTFRRAGRMSTPRERHAAVLLRDGTVLCTGGTMARPSARTERFDTETGEFTPVADMNEPRSGHSLTLLADGTVLVTGGSSSPRTALATAEIFDPRTNRFRVVGRMSAARHKHSASLLSDGRVLVAGGSDARDWDGQRSSAEIYDPRSAAFSPVSSMRRRRFKFSGAAALAGNVVVMGGGSRLVEIYDPARRAFLLAAGTLGDAWFYATATPLGTGEVLIAGGYNAAMQPTSGAWIYRSSR